MFDQIKAIFVNSKIEDFVKLPTSNEEKAKFAQLFSKMTRVLIASKLQGFSWDNNGTDIEIHLDENTYLILAKRYQELFKGGEVGGGSGHGTTFDIDPTCIEINTDKIDSDYLNSRFKKYVKAIQEYGKDAELADNIYKEIHKSFATLSQEEQGFAEKILYDLQNGNLFVDDEKSFRDYLNEYKIRMKNDQTHKFAVALGYDEELLRELVNAKLNEANLDEYGQFQPLKDSLNAEVASAYFEKKNGKKLPKPIVTRDAENLVKKFILSGGFDID